MKRKADTLYEPTSCEINISDIHDVVTFFEEVSNLQFYNSYGKEYIIIEFYSKNVEDKPSPRYKYKINCHITKFYELSLCYVTYKLLSRAENEPDTSALYILYNIIFDNFHIFKDCANKVALLLDTLLTDEIIPFVSPFKFVDLFFLACFYHRCVDYQNNEDEEDKEFDLKITKIISKCCYTRTNSDDINSDDINLLYNLIKFLPSDIKNSSYCVHPPLISLKMLINDHAQMFPKKGAAMCSLHITSHITSDIQDNSVNFIKEMFYINPQEKLLSLQEFCNKFFSCDINKKVLLRPLICVKEEKIGVIYKSYHNKIKNIYNELMNELMQLLSPSQEVSFSSSSSSCVSSCYATSSSSVTEEKNEEQEKG